MPRTWSSRDVQTAMGVAFGLMGVGTMLAPKTLIPISIPAATLSRYGGTSPVLEFVFRCFGAQAALCSVLILASDFTSRTWRAFGLAILPFFAFDYLAWRHGFLTPAGALLDAAGNLVFVGCSWLGHRESRAVERMRLIERRELVSSRSFNICQVFREKIVFAGRRVPESESLRLAQTQ